MNILRRREPTPFYPPIFDAKVAGQTLTLKKNASRFV
jgi:hypothetical protein